MADLRSLVKQKRSQLKAALIRRSEIVRAKANVSDYGGA
jgi:hypothetical protein